MGSAAIAAEPIFFAFRRGTLPVLSVWIWLCHWNTLRKKSNCLSASIRGNAKNLSLAQHLLLCDARSLNAAYAPSVLISKRSVCRRRRCLAQRNVIHAGKRPACALIGGCIQSIGAIFSPLRVIITRAVLQAWETQIFALGKYASARPGACALAAPSVAVPVMLVTPVLFVLARR